MMRFFLNWTILCLAAASRQEAEYGLDCSFPIHSKQLKCGNLLGDKQSTYQKFMEGCRDYYGAEDCDYEEDVRIAMNIRQPQSMVNFTSGGFRKIRTPKSLQKLLSDFWTKNKDDMEEELWGKGSIYTNHWDAPTYMVNVENPELEDGGEDLKEAIWDAAEEAIEDWTSMKLRPSSLYGVRVYTEGAILNPHVDRLPLVSSAIVNVAQDVDEDWPIEVYDRFDNAVNITMKPGDMVLYESGSLIHGRPFPLKGRYYANIFIHFEPVDSIRGKEFVDGEDQELPPYIMANSPGAIHWRNENDRWSKTLSEREIEMISYLAARGQLEKLKELGEKDPEVFHLEDENGWQPIHEAVRGGHLELLTYLIEEEEADVDIRTHDGLGATPLNIAKREHGMDHPIYLYLLDSGAKDLEGEEQGSEDDDEWVDGGLDEEEDNGEEEEEYIIEEEEEEEDSRDDDGDGDGDDDDEMLEEKGEESETDNQTTMGDDL